MLSNLPSLLLLFLNGELFENKKLLVELLFTNKPPENG